MSTVVLGYWKVRGVAEPIRLTLIHAGVKYVDELYQCGPAPDYDKSSWFNYKHSLGLDFPNLPYYLDGDVKLTQSDAILKYLGRKHNLGGTTEEELIRVDLFQHVIVDYRNDFARVCYSPNYTEELVKYLDVQPSRLQELSSFLGNRKFLAGENLTYVDFMLYEFLKRNRAMRSGCLNTLDNLRDFLARIEALPKIAEYLKSPSSSATYPMHNKPAVFGGLSSFG